MKDLEGILKAIPEISTAIDIKCIRKKEGRQIKTTSRIIIGSEEEHEICFPGIIFPDSIGHQVKYSIVPIPGMSVCHSPMQVGEIHYLTDLENKRTYVGEVRWHKY